MVRGKFVTLDSVHFANQSLAHAFFKEILNRYVPGEIVTPEDTVHLFGLFKRHPNYLEKNGAGVSHFEVMAADYGSQCFCAVLKDGSKEGFSYKRCITQKND
ncbi:DCL family protein [Undibacterium macrobrachii]|uniref:DUF3223 domain-containing protein n=1 Tax=Undibacterium macrobrachii TaxID=1119058 RepID=A0ABQ2XB27_9BURK|nr:DCL family protein [Undibacterium macrobrachii]GGX08655.1 hypothetical protein GCM10011282_13490 [Undibacterium macrobrachii]